MDYYEQIKGLLISNEIYKKAKDYSKNKNEIETYYNVGKLIVDAQGGENRAKYGNQLIKEYSKKLITELGKKYSVRYLFDIRKLYLFSKVHPLDAQLTMSHYRLLFPLTDDDEINYYIKRVAERKLSKRQLKEIIKKKEYERLPLETREKLIIKDKTEVKDLIPNPILIKNKNNNNVIHEKALHRLILEDIESFMKELGGSFCFVGSEYKIKIGDRYNFIDILLFNIKYNAYVVVELKVTEFKVEYISQVQNYMNYIDKNIKEQTNNNTIGILICKKEKVFLTKRNHLLKPQICFI